MQRTIMDVELYPVFQRIVKFSEPKKDFAFEALLRGKDREGNRMSPNNLFQMAAHQNTLEDLDFRARTIAIEEARSFLNDSLLFLNCHRDSLNIRRVFEEEIDFPLNQIVLEVTEKKKLHDVDEVVRYLQPYREAGMRLAIDDFGSGFSNFGVISDLAPDFVKLDQSLIANIDISRQACRVIEGMVAFANLTKTTLIAEGIERESQLHALVNLGIEYGQGFYLGLPQQRGEIREE